mgnify:CR=1 FL=1
MLEGISFSLQRSKLPIIIQSDCSVLVTALTDDSLNKSAHGHLILEIKRILDRFIPQKIDRHQNSVAYCLANIAHSRGSTTCSLHHLPDSVSNFALADCNTISEE